MKVSKKGITYKVGYKALKNMITEELEKTHQFATKKERKEVIKGVTKETRLLFEKSIAEQLNKSIDTGIQNYYLNVGAEVATECKKVE